MELLLFSIAFFILFFAWRMERKRANRLERRCSDVAAIAERAIKQGQLRDVWLEEASAKILRLSAERDRSRDVAKTLIQNKRAILLAPGVRAGEFI